VTAPLTADTITDAQIRELARSSDRATRFVARHALGLPNDAADYFLTWPERHSREAQRQRHASRATCAQILNEQRSKLDEEIAR
jgi:hypothetical protein